MDAYEAVMVCEGAIEPQSKDHYIKCWQHLVDTGLAWQLQGWFGRTAQSMIDRGILKQNGGKSDAR